MPNIFQPGTGPSSTRAVALDPRTATAAKTEGSLNRSGRFANRDVRERPRSFKTNHARADASERIRNARQVLVLEFGRPADR